MSRATLGFVAIVTAVVIAVQLPAILNGWTVAAWWTLLAIGTTGAVNIAIAILNYDEDDQ